MLGGGVRCRTARAPPAAPGETQPRCAAGLRPASPRRGVQLSQNCPRLATKSPMQPASHRAAARLSPRGSRRRSEGLRALSSLFFHGCRACPDGASTRGRPAAGPASSVGGPLQREGAGRGTDQAPASSCYHQSPASSSRLSAPGKFQEYFTNCIYFAPCAHRSNGRKKATDILRLLKELFPKCQCSGIMSVREPYSGPLLVSLDAVLDLLSNEAVRYL